MGILAITIPIFIFVVAGYIARRIGVIGEETKIFLSKIVYYFAFPAMTFRSIVGSDFSKSFNANLVKHNMLSTTTMFVLTFFMAFLIRNVHKRGAFNMGSFRSNQGYMGLPIIKGFYPKSDEAMSSAAIVNGFDSALVIILSVFALDVFRGKAVNKYDSKSALKVFNEKFISFITNPFVVSAVLGILLAYFKVPVLKFQILDNLLLQTGNMALPMALLSIGCSVDISHLKNNLKLVLTTTVLKLVIAPLIAFLISYYFTGFRGTNLGISVLLISMPTSVSSYVMACEMDTDEELMATIIGFTTFMSVLSISLTLYILHTFFH